MFYQEIDHISCRKYLWKQSEEYCCICDGTTNFAKEIENVNTKSYIYWIKNDSYLWCIFKNYDIPKYPSQLLKLNPKSHFLFSEFLCQREEGAFYDYILK